MNLNLLHVDPKNLKANPWNTNRVPVENQKKLDTSIKRLGNFKPILVRELTDGTLEIIGGQHRRDSALRSKEKTVPVLNLGKIDDAKAKEIGLVDNERYGEDDTGAMKRLLESLDSSKELVTFMPISTEELDAYLSYESIDISDLDLDDLDEEPIEEKQKSSPTHRVVRFKLAIQDAEKLSDLIEKTIKKQGFTESDALTNAGDALVHVLGSVW